MAVLLPATDPIRHPIRRRFVRSVLLILLAATVTAGATVHRPSVPTAHSTTTMLAGGGGPCPGCG
jgi:hypothetical protein